MLINNRHVHIFPKRRKSHTRIHGKYFSFSFLIPPFLSSVAAPQGGCSLVGRLWLAHGSVLRVQIVVLSSECCNPASKGFLCNPNHLPSPPFDCKPKHECNMLPGFILAAPSLSLLSLSFFLLASSFFVSSLIETYGNFSLCVCVCVGGWQLCTAALLINKQVLFDFITLSRAFLGQLRIHNEYLCLSKWECGTQVARGNNSCRQTHQLPKIAIRGVIGVVDGQQREREMGRGERTWHPQSACCVASNFINTFIILCHTASGTSGACTPLPCPTPLRPVQTAISLPQRALWLVIWRLISGLT